MKLKKEDTVIIVAGKDKGKKGKIREVLSKDDTVIVEGINIMKRHMKPRGQARQAGIIDREGPIHISNVMIVCPKCNKPVRVKSRALEDGKRARACCQCNEVIN
ncbi:MAG: 50S ribosomal protein L24 [Chloroflexota bacterium]|nr:50S ribosomal protein L24 [Chloroflexota bacterium]